MTKPLSVWKYYQANRRKVNVVFIITFLSVFLQCALSIYATTMLNLSYGTILEIFKSLTVCTTVNSTPEQRKQLFTQLKRESPVARIIPFGTRTLSFNFPAGECIIFGVDRPDMEPLMRSLKLHLIQGCLPAPHSREVVLHWRFAANQGLKIGDRLDKRRFPKEILTGEYRLTGLLAGNSLIGLCNLETFCQDYQVQPEQLQFALIPQPGRIAQLQTYLEGMANRNPGFILPNATENAVKNFQNQVDLMGNLIHLIIISILIICTGFLFYLYFYQRRTEFGLLETLGHTREIIIARSFGEIATIYLLGFGCAFSLCFFAGWALNHFILERRGLALTLWNPAYLSQLLATPLFANCCALVPVWRMLKKVDPLAIIEGQTHSVQRELTWFKPLSVWRYLLQNQRQAGVVFSVTCLSIVLLSCFLNYATSIIRSFERTELAIWTTLTYTGSVGYSDQSRAKQQRLRQALCHHPAVAKVLLAAMGSTSSNQIASPTVFFIEATQMTPIMAYLDLKLLRGRLPQPGTREILLHRQLAANKKLHLGDTFGNELSKQESLPGKFRIVGLFDGNAILGLANLEPLVQNYRFSNADMDLLVVPKPGRLDRVKHFLTQLRRRDQDIFDSATNERDARENTAIFTTLFNVVYGALAIIITICASFLFFLYFYKRRPEFGMLESLGHTRKMIVSQVLREIAGINLASFGLGLTINTLGGWILNRMLLNRYGIPLVLWDADYPGKLLPLPLLITCCSLIPVWRMLVKVEPLAMIEGEE